MKRAAPTPICHKTGNWSKLTHNVVILHFLAQSETRPITLTKVKQRENKIMKRTHSSEDESILKLFSWSSLVLIPAMLLMTQPVEALPSFAQQTNQPCSQCHIESFGPHLTAYGRQFKLSGYTLSGNPSFPPFSAMVEGPSFTHTAKKQPGGAAEHFNSNDNFAVDQISAFYGGRTVFPDIGIFSQVTYDGVDRHTSIDNTDIRFAEQATLAGNTVAYGITVNNNPTVQDLWNSTPAWGFPYVSSALAPTPTAAPLIAGSLAQQVLGLTFYTMWNDLVYLEGGGYTTLSKDTQSRLGVKFQDENEIDAWAPYWRAALQNTFGSHYFSVGTFGLRAEVFPGRDSSEGHDQYTDYGFDATYQSLGSRDHFVQANAMFIREDQNLSATYKLGGASKSSNTLNTLNLNATYVFEQTYGITLAYFQTTGNKDTLLYSPAPISGSANGSPDSKGYIVELDYIPFGKADSLGAPWLNVHFLLQYVGYTQFNGRSSNYDGSGRNASDNNTLFLLAWFAF
jgi:hypothetical protein